MLRPDGTFNPKRRILSPTLAAELNGPLQALAKAARYVGNPEHRKNPGDFGLTPPASPRRGKALCDDAGILRRSEALRYLREGMRRGLVDGRWTENGWPRNVWAVTRSGVPLEAQGAEGVYHGYPMPQADPLRDEVIVRCKASP